MSASLFEPASWMKLKLSLLLSNIDVDQTSFYPTALKGCRGIVFTHGVQMGGRREKFVRAVSQPVRYWKLILGRDIG